MTNNISMAVEFIENEIERLEHALSVLDADRDGMKIPEDEILQVRGVPSTWDENKVMTYADWYNATHVVITHFAFGGAIGVPSIAVAIFDGCHGQVDNAVEDLGKLGGESINAFNWIERNDDLAFCAVGFDDDCARARMDELLPAYFERKIYEGSD